MDPFWNCSEQPASWEETHNPPGWAALYQRQSTWERHLCTPACYRDEHHTCALTHLVCPLTNPLNCKYEAYFYCRYEVLRTSGHLKGDWFCVFYHLIRMPSLHFAVETASTVFFFPEHFLCVRAPNTCSWKSFRKGADFFSRGLVTCHPGSQKAAEDTRSGCVCVSWSSSDSNRKDHM